MLGHEEAQKELARLAEAGKLAHAYIFFGPSEVGKRTFALGFARFLESGSFEETERPPTDANLISPNEAGTIGIDESRNIRNFLSETPLLAKRRTVIVDEAQAMTTEAQNALLKTAEEPPPSSLLILITKDPELLMPTLVSRFQKLYFGPIGSKEIAEWLGSEHGIKSPEKIAAAAFGKPGLALRISNGELASEESSAREFLTVSPASRKEFLKELLDPEDFSFKRFLDSLISVLARDKKRNSALWHAVVELRGISDSTGLNPKIQLTNLWTFI